MCSSAVTIPHYWKKKEEVIDVTERNVEVAECKLSRSRHSHTQNRHYKTVKERKSYVQSYYTEFVFSKIIIAKKIGKQKCFCI